MNGGRHRVIIMVIIIIIISSSSDTSPIGEEEKEEEEERRDFGAPHRAASCSTVHELFEEQVKKTPDSIAVVFEDEQVSYRELNTRANQLAHYLSALGVAPERLVAICLERSVEMIVSILAV